MQPLPLEMTGKDDEWCHRADVAVVKMLKKVETARAHEQHVKEDKPFSAETTEHVEAAQVHEQRVHNDEPFSVEMPVQVEAAQVHEQHVHPLSVEMTGK